MSKKKAHSTITIPENCITQEQLVALVENICQDSINGPADFVQRLKGVYAQYHNEVAGKVFANKGQMIPFDSVDCSEQESTIINIIHAYLAGRIYDSMARTCSLWGKKLINSISIIHPHDGKNIYYRTRNCSKENAPTTPCGMFHTPYELRGLVGTARYSVPGFPSLYLTRNLYTAWEESRRANINNLYAARLQLQRPLSLMDLRLHRSFEHIQPENLPYMLVGYLRTIPLIIACSLKVKRDNDTFKPEYILPQLILHAVINETAQRYYMHPKAWEIGASDSSLETVDDILEALSQDYKGDIARLEGAIQEWIKTFPEGQRSIQSAAGYILNLMTMSKYGLYTPEQVLQINDRDWRLYNDIKGLRKFVRSGVDGIIYSSTRSDCQHWKDIDLNTDCIVVPIHTLDASGYCRFLSKAFRITSPICNSDAEVKVDLLEGNEYASSYFRHLEQALDKEPLFYLDEFANAALSPEETQQKVQQLLVKLQTICAKPQISDPEVAVIADVIRQLLSEENAPSLVQKVYPNIQLLSTAARKGGMSFWNFGDNIHNKTFAISNVYMGLLMKDVKGIGDGRLSYKYSPLGNANRTAHAVSLSSWLNEEVFELGGLSMNRRDIVCTIIDKDGVWSNIKNDEAYYVFSRPNALQLRVNDQEIVFENNPIFESLKQIAWELTESLKIE